MIGRYPINRASGKVRRLLVFAVVAAALLPLRARAASLCIAVEKNGSFWRQIRTSPGSEVRLLFQHSIYGSRVEEIFRLRPNGFQLSELRYAEHRLVDFYGHERARFENSMWVVKPQPALVPSLNLQTSSGAWLAFDHETTPSRLTVPTDGPLRLTVSACKDASDG